MNNMLAGVITSTLSSWGIKIRQLVMEEYGLVLSIFFRWCRASVTCKHRSPYPLRSSILVIIVPSGSIVRKFSWMSSLLGSSDTVSPPVTVRKHPIAIWTESVGKMNKDLISCAVLSKRSEHTYCPDELRINSFVPKVWEPEPLRLFVQPVWEEIKITLPTTDEFSGPLGPPTSHSTNSGRARWDAAAICWLGY